MSFATYNMLEGDWPVLGQETPYIDAVFDDYSCLDNVSTPLLEDSYHRLCSNYAHMAEFIYNSQVDSTTSTAQIMELVRRTPDDATGQRTVQITSFRQLLKFKKAVPLLVRLLDAGGIWVTIQECEKAFAALLKCKVEDVCNIYFKCFNV